MYSKSLVLLLASLLVSLSGPFVATNADELTPINLQLKWKHQFQFAGYYAAKAKGYYQEMGLDVRFTEATPELTPVEQVLKGGAQFGTGNSDLLLYRQLGEPVVALAVLFQHSPLCILARSDQVANLHDLVGKRIMMEEDSAELNAYLKREQIDPARLHSEPHHFGIEPVVAGEVAALSAYTTTEPFALREAGIDFLEFRPLSAGIDFYGDNLFTSERMLREHPEQVHAFRSASLKGWAYAMQHPEEIIELILSDYSQRLSREHLRFEAAEIRRLMAPDMVEIGYMNPGRWEHIAETYAELGMLPRRISLRGFLYDPSKEVDLRWLYPYLLAALLLLLAAIGVSLYILRLNRRLTGSERRYRTVYENAPLAFVLWDQDHQINGWNRAAEAIFGWPRHEALGRNVLELLVPESERQLVSEAINSTTNGAGPTHTLNWNLTKSGEPVMCEWINTALCDERGCMTVVALALDVTERVRTENRLRETLQTQQAIFDNSSAAICMVDSERRFVELNQYMCNLLGYRREELIGHSTLIMHPDEATWQRFGEEVYPRLRQSRQESLEYQLRHHNGELIWCHLSISTISPFELDQGAILVITDISAHKAIESELVIAREVAEQANRAKSAFLANMSHELRTPLNAILGFAQVLASHPDEEQRKRFVDGISGSGRHLLSLIDDVLDLAKVESGNFELHAEPFALKALLLEVTNLFEIRAGEKSLVFRTELDEALPELLVADGQRLRQILLNLLSNALKFTEHGEIALQAHCVDDRLHIRVSDTGIGIAPDDLERIFTPFGQLGESHYRLQGTGLGLSITRQLVELMQGEIRVRSTPGEGSDFLVDLPLLRAQLPRSSGARLSGTTPIRGYRSNRGDRPLRVLSIDTLEVNRRAIVECLQPLGFKVAEAANASSGLTRVQSWQPDLILLDMHLNDMPGEVLMGILHNMEESSGTPIIAISNNSDEEGCADAGACLHRPLMQADLLNAVQELLSLEWIYADSEPERGAELELDVTQISELKALLNEGAISQIIDYLQALNEANPESQTVCELLTLARDFQLDELHTRLYSHADR